MKAIVQLCLMTAAAVVLVPPSLRAQCSNLPAGCPSCTQCTYAPVTGTQPSMPEVNALMEELAINGLGDRGPTLPQLETGPTRTRQAPQFPCVLFKAIGIIESNWLQFCGNTSMTVVSFDCGYGISQITSGVSNYGARVSSEPAYNMGAGASILIGKWNAETTYGGAINDSNPVVVENWYYSTWAYNGFTNGNNPNNPNHPANRPPYSCAGGLSRGNYPYQELVWGRIRCPPQDNGMPRYDPVDVSYPNLADIPPPPSGTSLFDQDINITPQHADSCQDPCAQGCPDPSELIVDDLDPGFSVVSGNPTLTPTGGYNGGFRYAPSQPVGAPVVTTRFTPGLPSDGVWEISGWVPLNPATSANIPVDVAALGGGVNLVMDHSVLGGGWQLLGRAKLRAGFTHVDVRDDSGQPGQSVGMDAIRWSWVAFGGSADAGAMCTDSTDCRDSLICSAGLCALACFESTCAAGLVCDPQSGLCQMAGGSSSSAGSSSGGTSTSQQNSSAASMSSSSASSSSSSSTGGGASQVSSSQGGADGPPVPPGCHDAVVGAGRMPAWTLALGLAGVFSRRRRR